MPMTSTPPPDDQSDYPLSLGQQALWFMSKLDEDSSQYNISAAIVVAPVIERQILENVFQTIIDRHEALRTLFKYQNGKLSQFVQSNAKLVCDETDAREMSNAELQVKITHRSQQTFNLEKEIPFRLHLYTRKRDSVMFLCLHHIVSDFWSAALMIEEFSKLYGAFLNDNILVLEKPEYQFKDYQKWSSEWLQSEKAEKNLAYWALQLKGASHPLEIPTDRPRGSKSTFVGSRHTFEIDEDLTSSMAVFAKENNVTLFAVLLTAYYRFLSLSTDQQDITIGVPATGRTRKQEKGIVGYLVNPLPIRINPDDNQSFLKLFQHVNKLIRAGVVRQRMPFPAIVKQIGAERTANRSPIFQTMFAFQKAQNSDQKWLAALAVEDSSVSFDMNGIQVRSFPFDPGYTQFDLSLTMAQVEDRIVGSFQYNTDLFDVHTIEGFPPHFKEIITDCISEDSFAKPQSVENTLIEEIDIACKTYAQNIAISDGTVKFNYSEIYSHSLQWAALLNEKGVTQGDRIGIMLPHCCEYPAVMIGILRIGAVVVPIDIKSPANRLKTYVAAADIKLMIGLGATDIQPTDIDILPAPQENEYKTISGKADAVYVFTSGSTGRPRCVKLSHKNILNHSRVMKEHYKILPNDRVLQFTSPGFDVFLEEVFPTLFAGATIIPKSLNLSTDAGEFINFLERHQISVINIPTAYWRGWVLQMRENYSLPRQLRLTIVGGEAMLPNLIQKWFDNTTGQSRLINAYGPAETTVTATTWDVSKADLENPSGIPIGTPLPGVQTLVLDTHKNICLVDTEGELYISGMGLGNGYRDGEISSFCHVPNQKGLWFKTGDIVSQDSNGTLFFRGRIDDQIKILGVRVEPKEMERAFAEISGVSDSYICNISHQLVAFLESSKDLDSDSIRKDLATTFPKEFIPSQIEIHSVFPRTPAGKTDKFALEQQLKKKNRNEICNDGGIDGVQSIFGQLLNTPMEDDFDFFRYGGHSLLAVELALKLSTAFAVNIPVSAIFKYPTPRKMFEFIESIEITTHDEEIELVDGQVIPLTYQQKRIIHLKTLMGTQNGNSLKCEFLLSGNVDVLKLQDAWQRTTKRHDVLNLKIDFAGDRAIQKYHKNATSTLQYDESLPTNEANRHATGIGGTLVKESANLFRLTIESDHLFIDGTSMHQFISEVACQYNGETLPPQATGYCKYALIIEKKPDNTPYWEKYLSGLNPPAKITIRDSAQTPSFQTSVIKKYLGREVYDEVQTFSLENGRTPASILLTTFQLLLRRYCSTDEQIIIGLPTSDRGNSDTNGIIGNLTNFCALATKILDEESFLSANKKTSDDVIGAMGHQKIELSKLFHLLEASPSNPIEFVYLFQQHELQNIAFLGFEVTTVDIRVPGMPAPLTLEVAHRDDQFVLSFHYDNQLYSKQAISSLSDCFETMLSACLENPHQPNFEHHVLPFSFLESCFGAIRHSPSKPKYLHKMFTKTAKLHPFKTAIVVGDRKYNYGKVYRQTTRVARVVNKAARNSIKPFVVGILLDKGWEQITSSIGTLRGGAIYAPIDINLSEKAVLDLLEDSQIKMIFTSPLIKKLYDWPSDVLVLSLDDKRIRHANPLPMRKTKIKQDPRDPAYIMYTSGTTGKPKGVVMAHDSVVNTVENMNRNFAINSNDVFFCISNFFFDLSVYDIYGAFAEGARVVLPDPDKYLDSDHWVDLVQKHGVTIWNSVPALYSLFLERLETPVESLKQIMLSGDWIPLQIPLKSKKLAPSAQLTSFGGATEAAIWSIGYPVKEIDSKWKSIPYGYPLENQECHVLNAKLNYCPPGVPGELYIGGIGVALEYYRNKEASEIAFITHPKTKQRLYKTGDLCVLNHFGIFEILGRLDSRVKIGGRFVDLASVEREIESHPNVSQAAALPSGSTDERQILSAFVVSDLSEDDLAESIRTHIAGRLPRYMIPSRVAKLDTMPLTTNGKVDRTKLIGYSGHFLTVKTQGRLPESPSEKLVAKVWEKYLKIENVCVEDNFFDLGGDSLGAIEIVAEIGHLMEVDIPIQTILVYPTLKELAPVLEGISQSNARSDESSLSLIKGLDPKELANRVRLDKSIVVNPKTSRPSKNPNYLLTGATGFLGSRLLSEILTSTQSEVYCIVRGDDPSQAMDRVRNKLSSFHNLTVEQEKRITVVRGDVGQARIGLAETDYDLLARKIDHIIHCAAKVNFVLFVEALVSTNVYGSIEILKLSTAVQQKKISYISTVSVFPTIANDIEKTFMENDSLDQRLPIYGGYSQSKWISESTMHEARSRGIPISVFRPGVIFGDTRNAELPSDVMLVNFIKFCLKMGTIPDLDILVDIAPVDYVAKAIIQLSKPDTFSNECYHLTNPRPVHLRDFIKELSEVGLKLELCSQKEWNKRVVSGGNKLAEGTGFEKFLPFLNDMGAAGSIAFGRNLQQFDCTNTVEALRSNGLKCPNIDKKFLSIFSSGFRV
jgi:amino acid adenylation domain-containing protein/thioester reductase-like protein